MSTEIREWLRNLSTQPKVKFLIKNKVCISYFEAHNNPRTSARPGYAGLWQVLSVTKDCFWGNLEIKEIKIDFFGILRHHIRNKFIQVWFLANFAPCHLSYRNFLNICRRKKIKKPTERSFCQFSHAIFIGFNRWLVIFIGGKNR